MNKGTNLLSGERWSPFWDGYIEKPNGLLRKPRIWVDPRGNKKTANSYYFVGDCDVCKKPCLKDLSNAKKSKRIACSSECRSKLMTKPDGNRIFKRGTIDSHIMVKAKDHPMANKSGYVPEHRLFVEKHLGRYLKRTDQVHHINLIKNDNDLSNLVVFKNSSEHFKAHGSLNKCVAKLIDKNVLMFNRETNEYEVIC
jgi:hypothetical protein